MMTKEQLEHMINEYAIEDMPEGWRVLDGTLTQPIGYVWVSNGKSLFGGEYKHALIKEELIR